MVKFSSIIYLRSLALVSLIGLMVDSKSHHAHHAPSSHLHPHSDSRHQRHYDLHHRKSSRNKRSESTVNPLDVNFINNNNSNNKSIDINTDSDKKSMINSDKSLVDLEKLFGPIPHQLYDHIRVKRNNLKNNFGESNPRASSEYLKKLADSFAGPAAENDQDNFDELETNDRQLSFNSDDLMRKKRRADLDDDFEETNFFPDDSRLVNLIRTKRFGDPDKRIVSRSAKGKRNVRNKNIKQEHADGKGRDGFRLKRKSKITGNKRLKKENLKVDKLSRVKNKVKDKSKLKRCTKSSISKNDKNLNKKHDKVKNKIRKRRDSVGDSKALAPLEEIRDLAANLVSKVDELEGSIKINRRSGRNSHGYPAISNSKRVHHLLGSGHSASDFSYSPDKFMVRPIMRMKGRKNRERIRKMKRKRKRKRMNDDNDIDNKIDTCKKPRGMKNKKWARWTDWSSCSVTCGKGRQIRWRHCRRNCKNAETEMEEKTCQLPACAPARLFGIF